MIPTRLHGEFVTETQNIHLHQHFLLDTYRELKQSHTFGQH